MKTNEQFLQLVTYLTSNYPDAKNMDGLFKGANREQAVLKAINEFAGYSYDREHKFFVTQGAEMAFATEMVELEKINTVVDLHRAINYLNDARDQRFKSKEPQRDLPKHLFSPPDSVQEVTRKNIMTFLQKTYHIEGEKELFELEESKQREVIYDIYKNFTGYVPLTQMPGRIIKSIPNESEVNLSYGNYPNFLHNTLFSHIRDMRDINENTQQAIQKTTAKRISELRRLTEAQLQKREQDQDIEQ